MNDLTRPFHPNLPNNPSSSSSSARRTLGQVPSASRTPHPLPAPSQPPAESKKVNHVPCRFFRQGACTAGSACIFAHVQPEAGQQKQPCEYFQKGSCKFGRKCALAHILPGQPMSMDRKNKKAAEAQAQALQEKVLSSLSSLSASPQPPIPRANSTGTSSPLNTVPTKPQSPSKPNELPPNPITAAAATSSQETASEGSTEPPAAAAIPIPSTSKVKPLTTKGFSFASLFNGSSSKLPSGSTLPARPSGASGATVPLNPNPVSPLRHTTPKATPSAPSPPIHPPTQAYLSNEPTPASLSSNVSGPPPSEHGPTSVSFGFGLAVRASNGHAYPQVLRKDIVFGSTDRENTTSPPLSFSPTINPLTSLPSSKHFSVLPTPTAPPHTRRTSHGPVSPPASSSSYSPHSFHPSPQQFHPTPTPLSPTRRLAPPLSSSSSYNAGAGVIGAGGGASGGASPFSSSPFFPGPLVSRGVFLSSSYENHDFDRSGSFSGTLHGGQPASMVDLDHGGGRWGGRDQQYGRTHGEEETQGESDDGEELLPSSLSELLSPEELERKMSRRGSNAGGSSGLASTPQKQHSWAAFGSETLFPTSRIPVPSNLVPHSPTLDDHQARMMSELNFLPRGHNSVPALATTAKSALGSTPEMLSPWDDADEVVEGGGTGRTVGRGRNTVRRPPVPFETSTQSTSTAISGEGDGSFKLGPSHASVAFLPNFGERRNPFGHDQQSSTPLAPPTSLAPFDYRSASATNPSYSTGFPAPLSSSSTNAAAQQTRWNLPFLSSSSFSTATTDIDTIPTFSQPQQKQQQHPSPQFGGFGQPQDPYHLPSQKASTATLMGAPLTPAELAASHEPGMSLPPGLGIGLGRTRIPFGVGVESSSPSRASNTNSSQPQQQPYSTGPWGATTTSNSLVNGSGTRPPPLGGARWITSIGGGEGPRGARSGVVEQAEDEIEDDLMFR